MNWGVEGGELERAGCTRSGRTYGVLWSGAHRRLCGAEEHFGWVESPSNCVNRGFCTCVECTICGRLMGSRGNMPLKGWNGVWIGVHCNRCNFRMFDLENGRRFAYYKAYRMWQDALDLRVTLTGDDVAGALAMNLVDNRTYGE